MRRALMLSLLLSLAMPLCSQSLSAPVNDWPLCFDADQWAKFEDEIWDEMQRTVNEAVTEAVKPHIEYEKTLQEKLDRITCELNVWKYTAIGTSAVTLALIILTLLR